jgi:hypothetical protein
MSIVNQGQQFYVVKTDLDPSQLDDLALEIFRKWVSFALGGVALGSKRIKSPTGKYASSIHIEMRSENEVAILADVSVAKEAGILETGHKKVDLKTRLQHGKAYPMHRGAGAPGLSPKIWAEARSGGFNGFASIGAHSAGWIIPAMPAYAPAKHLADLANKLAGRRAAGASA